MELTAEQQALLDGEKGETMAKVMKTLVMYGETFGATKMVPVTGKMGHLVTSFGLGVMKPVYDLMARGFAAVVRGIQIVPYPRDQLQVRVGIRALRSDQRQKLRQAIGRVGLLLHGRLTAFVVGAASVQYVLHRIGLSVPGRQRRGRAEKQKSQTQREAKQFFHCFPFHSFLFGPPLCGTFVSVMDSVRVCP